MGASIFHDFDPSQSNLIWHISEFSISPPIIIIVGFCSPVKFHQVPHCDLMQKIFGRLSSAHSFRQYKNNVEAENVAAVGGFTGL